LALHFPFARLAAADIAPAGARPGTIDHRWDGRGDRDHTIFGFSQKNSEKPEALARSKARAP
jgi:hypothetical protein